MKVKSSSIQQLDKSKPKARCRDWRLWANTDCGRRSRRFHGTWTEAQDALRAFVSELSDEIPDSETFGAYAESWRLWRAESGRLSDGSVREDARKVRALLRSPIAGKRLADITPDACRDALLWVKSHPASGSAQLTNTTMQRMHGTLRAILQQAEDDGRIARNPMARVKPPKCDTREREALSPLELQLFLNRVDGLPLDGRAMALYLMACLGLRRGEACGLMDADVRGGFACVRSSVDQDTGRPAPTKSRASVRTLPVPQRLEERIALWRECRRALGIAGAPTLACNAHGGILRPQNLAKWWQEVSPSLGCDGMVLHQLRHSNLSMVARSMSPFDLQRYAGWSSIAPARIYVHDDMDSMTRGVMDAWA